MSAIPLPDARLLSALPYLTRGGRVADVGTDHAYLPICLLHAGISSRALASDIHKGPIASARANIAAAGLTDRIETLLTDGLHGVESFCPDDILIFGMGGELIARILSEAPWVRRRGITLILQPMSRAAALRAYLTQNGFRITGETLTLDDAKYYQTLSARACAPEETEPPYTEVELLLGRQNMTARTPLFDGFVRHEVQVLEKVIAGKSKARRADFSEELRMKAELEELIHE